VAQLPGDALANVGQDVATVGQGIFNEQQNLWRAREAMDKTAQSALESEKLYNQITTDPNIKDEDLVKNVQDGFKILHDRIGQDIKDPVTKLIYDKNFTALTVQRSIDAMTLQRSRTIDNGRASLLNSLDVMSRLVPDATGQRLDAILAQAQGNIAFAATSGLIKKEDAQQMMQQFRENAYTAKYDKQIRENPAQAFSDLQSDTNLDPIKKELLIDKAEQTIQTQAAQYLADRKAADEEAAKQRKFHMDADVTNATDAALKGQLTYQNLEDIKTKYATGGEPLSRENYEHLFDLINKPLQQPPSDPQTLSDMKILVNSADPPPLRTILDLHQNGQLNLDDRADLAVELERNKKSQAIQNRTQLEKVLADEFGADKSIHAAALKDMLSGASLKQIEETYQPVYKVSSEFKGAQNSYETALNKWENWNSQHYFRSFFSTAQNPNNDELDQRKQQFIDAAKKAHKLIGNAPNGLSEGSIHLDAQGNSAIVVKGQYVAQ